MQKDLLIECEIGQTRLALVEDGDLSEIYIERKGHDKLVGNIYAGRVANVLPGMQAAFVDIGIEKNGFLYAGDIQVDKRDFDAEQESVEKQLAAIPIRRMVKVGQEILVQVTKEPGGTKGPRISNNITLPGRMAVLLPTVGYVGVSRRIEDEEERTRLRLLAESVRPEGMGLIVRTAAEGADADALREDVEYLTKLWSSIKTRAEHTSAPALLHRDVSLVYRAVRDMLLPDVHELLIDSREQYLAAKETADMLSKELSDKVVLYEGATPLFDVYGVDAHADKALARRVWLKSGGYLVFDYAEALTVIDVNTGKYVGKHSLSDTVFRINCEAVVEIARQLRLRDIGGIIVIDFIDMDLPEQREQMIALLRKELKKDRTKTNLVGLTGLGLVEMTRKKVHQPIHTLLKHQCPLCQGMGMVLSDESIAHSALHELRARAGQSQAFLVETAQGVAGQMLLIGCGACVRAYVRPVDDLTDAPYRISPVNENELPPKTRQIPRQQRM